jgi:hypothetical protein
MMQEHFTDGNYIFADGKIYFSNYIISTTAWEHIVAYVFKARIVEPEESSISREQHGNSTRLCSACDAHNFSSATGMHTTIKKLLEQVILVREDVQKDYDPKVQLQKKKISGREPQGSCAKTN